MKDGIEMHKWAEDLWPINRSITGEGVRETLDYIKNLVPDLNIIGVPSGLTAFDWTVPDEWNVKTAYIENEFGDVVIDFKNNNLHLVGYSVPVDLWLDFKELDKHLHSLPDQPDLVPYVTSYYKEYWGFCISHEQRSLLDDCKYHVVIDSKLHKGELNFADLIIPGEEETEVLLSTYICHPSLANNELSGPVVTIKLIHWLMSLKERKYTYRVVFIPETIGSIVYINKNLDHLKRSVVAGFNITCIGDDRCYSYLPSKKGNTLSDIAALHVLKHTDVNFKSYSWIDRGSDERQYCSPGVDLPIASIMRSKYGEYPEYHTSGDDLNFVTPSGLEGGYVALKRTIEVIENNIFPLSTMICEPQLSKRGLYPTLSTKDIRPNLKIITTLISFSDGSISLLDIANKMNTPFWEILKVYRVLLDQGLLNSRQSPL